jgi:5-formyltetrahydrofolate cyclo-ligase
MKGFLLADMQRKMLFWAEKRRPGKNLRVEDLNMKEDRQELRQKILGTRDGLSESDRYTKSISVMHNFWTLLEREQWSTLFIYVNFRSEVETEELIKRCIKGGIRVAVPLVDASAVNMIPFLISDPERDLKPGYYNIPEPDPQKALRVAAAEIDAAVIPGSVFDIHGGRLGYGGGYYDRFLLNDAPQAKRIGFAFELQVVEKVPLEPHDQPLDILITEKRIVNIPRSTREFSNA